MNNAYVGALWQRGILKKIACDENEFLLSISFVNKNTVQVKLLQHRNWAYSEWVLFDHDFFPLQIRLYNVHMLAIQYKIL